MEDIPVFAPNAPKSRKKVVEFFGPQVEGFTIGLTDIDLARISSGMSFLHVVDNKSNASLLQTRIDSVSYPFPLNVT